MGNEKFDLTVHKRNKKGYISSKAPYRLRVVEGKQLFERPPGSGVFYNADNTVAKAPEGWTPEVKPAAQPDAVAQLAAENAALRLELEKLLADKPAEVEFKEEEPKVQQKKK